MNLTKVMLTEEKFRSILKDIANYIKFGNIQIILYICKHIEVYRMHGQR